MTASHDAPPHPPRAIVAVVLSGFAPGAGHLYLGRPLRGLFWVAALAASVLAWAGLAASSFTMAKVSALPVILLLGGLLVDSAYLARGARHAPAPRTAWQRPWAVALAVLVGGLVVPSALAAHAGRMVGAFCVSDDLMQPLLVRGDIVVCDLTAYRRALPPFRALALVELSAGRLAARRVVGLPGDDMEVRRGTCVRNGAEEVEDYHLPLHAHELFVDPSRLKSGVVLALSDQRDRSERTECVLPTARLRGRPTWILWPSDLDAARIGQALP